MVEQFSNFSCLIYLFFSRVEISPSMRYSARLAYPISGGSTGGDERKGLSSLLAVGREESMVTIDSELVDTLGPIRGVFVVDIEHPMDVESDGGIEG